MIPAASVQDQELPIAPKCAGVNHPTVTRRRDLRAGPGSDGKPLLGSAGAIGTAEFADSGAIDRQTQTPSQVGEGDSRGQAAGVAKRGEVGPRRILRNSPIGIQRRARRRIETRFELGDEVLDVVDLVREIGCVLLLDAERLLRNGLPLLPLVDEETHAQLVAPELIEIVRELVAL